MTPHQKQVERTARALTRLRNRNRGLSDADIAEWHLRMGGRAPGEREKLYRVACDTCESGTPLVPLPEPCNYCWRARPQLGDNWRPKKGGAK